MSLQDALRPGSVDPDHVQVLPFGLDGILVRFAVTAEPWATQAAQAFHDYARSADLPFICERAPSLSSVLLRFDPAQITREAAAARIESLLDAHDWRKATPRAPERLWTIPVAFGGAHGPDLEAAAELAGMRPEAAIAEITGLELRVLAIGFAPGQPYLGLLPEAWNLPRMEQINPQVPKGAIALAVRQLVLFANPSPTGWRQIGRTAFAPFRPEAEPAVPLRAGDALRLSAVSGDEMTALLNSGDPAGGALCESVT
ncbi:allophanate hydrolase subunit 1 [Thioclava sp. BHET1]|nr:allophanate hydrolase subunit 1 [Thioclava sp. BHET1]